MGLYKRQLIARQTGGCTNVYSACNTHVTSLCNKQAHVISQIKQEIWARHHREVRMAFYSWLADAERGVAL